jgi:hypothetical protein
VSAFTTKLNVQYVDGKHWILLSPFIYRVGSADSDEVVFVHAGFKTDFASIPHWAWPVLGHPTGKHGKAAVIHDYLYQYPYVRRLHICSWNRSRRRCDQIFLEGMKVLGVSWWKRTVMYSAVRVGGRGPWRRYREAE